MKVDQCQRCTVRGDIEACKVTPCNQHESWYAVTMHAKIAALEKDAARLDFLNSIGEAYGFESTIEGYRWEVSGAFRTVRDAIDSERVAVEAEATIKIETITHPHFGDDPVTVYAIKLQKQVKP